MGGTFVKVGLNAGIFSGFSMMLTGFVLWLCFWIIYLTFPFKLVDAFVQWAFVLALMPLWIVLWVFPATRGYTKKAWEMFLGASLQFVALSVMIALVLQLIDHIVPANLSSASDSISRSQFFEYLIEGKDGLAASFVGFGSGMFMNAIAFCAMSFGLLGAASKLASSIAGGGGEIGVGKSMATPIALAGKGAQAVGTAAFVGSSMAAGKIGSALKDRFGGRGGSGSGSGSDESSTRAAALGTYGGGSDGSSGSGSGSANNSGSGTDDSAKPAPIIIKGDKGDKGENAEQTESRGGGPSSGGSRSGNDGSPALGNMSSEEKKVVADMAKKPNSVNVLKSLSDDIAFIEELRAQKPDRDAYKKAIDGHQWKTENQAAMKHFADEAYTRSDRYMPSLYEDTVSGALKDQNVIKLRTDFAPMSERMRKEFEGGNKVSAFLSAMADDVKKAGGSGG